MYVNDIFITGYWAGPELLRPELFICMKMVLCFREVGRARTSSLQMFYMYVNGIYFFT